MCSINKNCTAGERSVDFPRLFLAVFRYPVVFFPSIRRCRSRIPRLCVRQNAPSILFWDPPRRTFFTDEGRSGTREITDAVKSDGPFCETREC